MEYRSLDDLNRTVIRASCGLQGRFDLVVGVPRSGLLVANLIGLYLNVPIADFEGFLHARVLGNGTRGVRGTGPEGRRRVLVVDDSVASGKAMNEARQRIAAAGLAADCTYAAAYVVPGSERHVDLAFETVDSPRLFQWNLLHHGGLKRCCFDIDGVLCADPTWEQNDDGEAYRCFIENATPLLLPTAEIGWLVTSRLKKYRELTERWLIKHGIRFQHLAMLDLPSKEARQKARAHASFKADVYRSCGAELFVESEPAQAAEIAQRSGLPVLCYPTQQVFRASGLSALPISAKRVGRGIFSYLRNKPRRACRRLWSRRSARASAERSCRRDVA